MSTITTEGGAGIYYATFPQGWLLNGPVSLGLGSATYR